MEQKDKFALSASALKYIAVITMLIDHIGAAVVVNYTSNHGDGIGSTGPDICYFILRMIGRQAFPIYCFLLVEGFYHTRSVWRYLGRLAIFSVLSEVPYDLAFHDKLYDFSGQNVYWTLFLGLLGITLFQRIRQLETFSEREKKVLTWIVSIVFVLSGFLLHIDYEGLGILLIFVFYWFRQERIKACFWGYLCLVIEIFSFPAFFLIYHHKGVKGKGNKYFFYLFYPVHLLVLVGIRRVLMQIGI